MLVDSSIWIEYFNPRPQLSPTAVSFLAAAIKERQVSIIEPIRVEILSGEIRNSLRNEISRCIECLGFLDLPWGKRETWDYVIELATLCREMKLPVLGLIDRMILSAALKSKEDLWTLDKAMIRFGRHLGITMRDER